ncbi:MAG: SH3 domain-containing protein [Muribaculaceae bacterium]|nr:SH3 domain-containing protein [Muribaculaceae bacterium]
MKRVLNFIILLLTILVLAPGINAREFGNRPEWSPKKYMVTPGKKLNVRSEPSPNSALIYQLKPGDIIYVSDTVLYEGGGYNWVKVSDKWGQGLVRDGYITNLQRFDEYPNPQYDPPTEKDKEIDKAVTSSQTVAKWVLLALAIIAFITYLVWMYKEDADEKIFGRRENGMRKTFFFNIAPYRSVIFLTLGIIASIAAALAIVLLLGGVVFGLLWLVKILCYVVLWVGIISCVLGILACIAGQWAFIVVVILGGVIWYYDDEITGFGEACANTGLQFFNEFNLLGYVGDLAQQYWKPALIITCIPLAIFLALAIIWMIVAGILIGYEKLKTRRYNINHPCPHCQQPSEPAIYLSHSDEGYIPLPNDIRLRPGVYGLFHITHPYTGERMPTMLMNGRDNLARECANCGRRIQANEGTECHVAMVGSAMSGKSTLTYRMIAEIFSRAGEHRVEFTDVKNSVKDTQIITKVASISQKGYISEDDLPNKTTVDDVASTQLIIKRKNSSVPYRFFINDVGGELFDSQHSASGTNATRYFRNVDSILLVIDPITTDLTDYDTSKNYKEWLKNNEQDVRKLPIKDIQATIDNQISHHGVNPKRIHLNIILSKSDLGYIPEDVDLNSQEELTTYLEDELGLGSLLHWAKKFASCTIIAVAATSHGEKSNVTNVLDTVVVGQLGIKLD